MLARDCAQAIKSFNFNYLLKSKIGDLLYDFCAMCPTNTNSLAMPLISLAVVLQLVNLELTTDESPSKNEDGDKCPKDCKVTDATFPHGTCSAGDEGIVSGIIHPTAEEGLGNGDTTKHNKVSWCIKFEDPSLENSFTAGAWSE